jgi:hypothetical protein
VKRFSAAETVFNQLIGTLYGVRQVVYLDETKMEVHGRECLHVVPGVFERWPEIEAAVVTAGEAITLCVNEFSDRALAFQSSLLCDAFQRRGGPVKPSDLEGNHGFWSIADRTIDRRSQETVQRYLSQRYNVEGVHILDIKNHYVSTIQGRQE